jgi:hypothetical protein
MSSNGLSIAEFIVLKPPSCLSELESLTGRLNVDFAGREGMLGVSRDRGSAHLRAGIVAVSFDHRWDMHHQDPYKPRDLVFERVMYTLDAPYADVRNVLSKRFRGRAIASPRGRCTEFGPFYLHAAAPDADLATFTWESARPEWAHPPADAAARGALLQELVPALLATTTARDALAQLGGLLAPAGAKATEPAEGGFVLRFEPALALQPMLEAFGWRDAIAYSSDVHMVTWRVRPNAMPSRPANALVGAWDVTPRLTGWPKGEAGSDLPALPPQGPPEYRLATCVTEVAEIRVVPALRRAGGA